MRLYLILLLLFSTAFGKAQLFIAYNPSDCAMCNVMFGDFFKQENTTPLTVVYPSYVGYIDDSGLTDMWMVSQFEANSSTEVLYSDSLYGVLSENGRSSISFISGVDKFSVEIDEIKEIKFPENDFRPLEISLKEQPFNQSIGRPISLGFRAGKEVIFDRPTTRFYWKDIDKPIFAFSSLEDSLLVGYYRKIGFTTEQIDETLSINSQLPFSVISAGTFILQDHTIFGMLRIRLPERDTTTISFTPRYCIVAIGLVEPYQSIKLYPIESSGLEGYTIQYYYNFEKNGDRFYLRVCPDSITAQSHYLAEYILNSTGKIEFSKLLNAYPYPERLYTAGFNYELSGAYLIYTNKGLLSLFRNEGIVYSNKQRYPVTPDESYFSGTFTDLDIHMANDDFSSHGDGGTVILRGNYVADQMEILHMTDIGDIERIAEYPSAKYVYGKVLPTFAVLTKIEKPKMKRTIYYWE